jgi:hypothetical protein
VKSFENNLDSNIARLIESYATILQQAQVWLFYDIGRARLIFFLDSYWCSSTWTASARGIGCKHCKSNVIKTSSNDVYFQVFSCHSLLDQVHELRLQIISQDSPMILAEVKDERLQLLERYVFKGLWYPSSWF